MYSIILPSVPLSRSQRPTLSLSLSLSRSSSLSRSHLQLYKTLIWLLVLQWFHYIMQGTHELGTLYVFFNVWPCLKYYSLCTDSRLLGSSLSIYKAFLVEMSRIWCVMVYFDGLILYFKLVENRLYLTCTSLNRLYIYFVSTYLIIKLRRKMACLNVGNFNVVTLTYY